MPLNYSKWDALELSDDSDIECHPNVDKRSFIRLKQRQIHQQRDERKQKIEQLKHEAGLNATLLEKINQLLQGTKKDGADHLRQTASKLSTSHQVQPTSSDVQPTIDQMIFNLISQVLTKIKNDNSSQDEDSAAEEQLKFHLKRLSDREEQRKVELQREEAEAKKHITSEDIHDGFDVSHVDRKPSAAIDEPLDAPSKPKSTQKIKKTNLEVLNPQATHPSSHSPPKGEPETDEDEDDDDDDDELPRLSPSAQKFAKIKSADYSSSLSAIQADPSLYLNESTTDALLVEAFESEMKGKKTYAKNCVHQGLLLQYCRKLGRDGVSLFFRKVGSGEPKAMQVFLDDVNSTYDRISNRCAVIIAERAKEPTPKEQIQLVPTNPSTSISFEVPDGPPPENLELKTEDPAEAEKLDIEEVRRFLWDRWNTFNAFPKKLQKALRSKQLERVNQVIGEMEILEAEKIVQDLDRVGILCFSEAGIIDKTGTNEPGAGVDQPAPTTHDSVPNQVVIPDDLSS